MRNRFFVHIVRGLFFFFLFSAAAGSACLANDIDSTRARKYAKEFFIQKGWSSTENPDPLLLVFKPIFLDSTKQYSDYAYYVFQIDQKGYVAISAWNLSRTILFYAEGDFKANAELEVFQYWINFYIDLMREKYDDPVKVDKSIVIESKSGDISFSKGPGFVEPLLTTTWNQGCYYNELCPADAGGSCGHVPVGCVAVAMAQIINYHEYPEVGVGSFSYTHEVYGEQSADFSEGYDYTSYPDYINSSNPELARFLYHCGVAVEMDYTPTVSLAYSSMVVTALLDYFNYSETISYLSKSSYSEVYWNQLLIDELANGRPFYYRGSNDTDDGHAFVCDAYDEFGLFHFNFGWGGSEDGYFALEDLTFNNSQAAIVNIKPQYNGPVNVQDSLALVSLYNLTNGASWTNNENWLTGKVSDWHGIQLEESRVTYIELFENNLTGDLINDVWTIDSLQLLDLANNQLTGQIPAAIANLNYLKGLILDSNQLTGTIPGDIFGLQDLILLSLSDNQLSGEIPTEIASLTNLQEVCLDNNQFTGSIPLSICNLLQLEYLSINNNELTGGIPIGIANLNNLMQLKLAGNNLTGDIVAGIWSLTNLYVLSLSYNQLTGTIPVEIANLPRLQYLILNNNNLTGAIPSEIGVMTNLKYLRLHDNHFTSFPDLSSLEKVEDMQIQNNQLTFDDIEPNMGVAINFNYAPQAKVGEEQEITLAEGDNYTLSVDCGGTFNIYQWYKDSQLITAAQQADYTITNVGFSDTAEYHCQVTNTLVSGLTISSNPINIEVLPAGWSYEESEYTYSGLVNALVYIDDQLVSSGYLGAFVGDDCRAYVSATYYEPQDHYLFELACYSDSISGDTLTLKYYDPLLDSIFDLYQPVEFIPDMNLGTLEIPIEFKNYRVFSTTFVEGWTWFSLNVSQEHMSVDSLLNMCATDGDYIKNQTQSSTFYDGYNWFGTLINLDPVYLYLLKATGICGMDITGISLDVDTNPISLVPGWNWISYFPQVSMPIGDAFSSLSLDSMDYIKSQTGSATYYPHSGWFGALQNLNPGDGFMVKFANPHLLYYPVKAEPAAGKSMIANLVSNSEFKVDPHEFQYSGTITARIFAEGFSLGSENDLLLAYVGDQLRGVSRGYYFKPADAFAFPLMIYSNINEGELINFKYHNANEDKLYVCNETILFKKDMIIADVFHSFNLSIDNALDINSAKLRNGLSLTVYPNPFRDMLTISFSIDEPARGLLSVYDMYGKMINVLREGKFLPGTYSLDWKASGLPSGVYIVKLNTDKGQLIERITLIE